MHDDNDGIGGIMMMRMTMMIIALGRRYDEDVDGGERTRGEDNIGEVMMMAMVMVQ